MSWDAGLLITPGGNAFEAVVAPQMPGEPLTGYAVAWLCPWACTHLLAYESEIDEAMALAAARLDLLNLPTASTLVIISAITRHHHEHMATRSKELSEMLRGCAN